jgi:hypothetical protein
MLTRSLFVSTWQSISNCTLYSARDCRFCGSFAYAAYSDEFVNAATLIAAADAMRRTFILHSF